MVMHAYKSQDRCVCWVLKRMKLLIIASLVVIFVVAALRVVVARHRSEDMRTTRARALQGDPDAEQKLGSLYFYGIGATRDYAQALQWYRKAAGQGNAKAQYNLGYMYNTGTGVQQDLAEASRWYELAANGSDGRAGSEAECALAGMYYDGRGVPQDRAKAATLYRRSADQGLARAQYDLGYMLFYGQGVPRDRVEGNKWFRKAAEKGDERAKRLLGLKLKPWLALVLIFQGGVGFVLAFRPLSLNFWEPNQGIHGFHDWLSIGTGALLLLTAGLKFYGYTHNLIWCLIYGFTGFQLLTWFLQAIAMVLLYVVFFGKKSTGCEVAA